MGPVACFAVKAQQEPIPMTKRMLIDASHCEETRVVVHENNRLEDFDYETFTRKQLKGNIYLAQVTRVEPSLQAAFVEYGGNRHGFLPFGEVHPDYYRLPLADREALEAVMDGSDGAYGDSRRASEGDAACGETSDGESALETQSADFTAFEGENAAPKGVMPKEPEGEVSEDRLETISSEKAQSEKARGDEALVPGGDVADASRGGTARDANGDYSAVRSVTLADLEQDDTVEELAGENSVDSLNDEDESSDGKEDETSDEEHRRRVRRLHFLRRYRIQEVIRRKQVLLVQVTKEERGNKGATLTTYLSLAGRYSVLMPNTNKGGGISRRISNSNDRKRLKDILSELSIPEGIAVIVRTAGSQRSKVEIRRDYEYLMRLWNEIRATTLESEAPCLIYEEADLIRRAIRDLYTSDMEEILVEGEKGYKAAKNFMRALIPSHARKVKQYKGMQIPLFHRYQVESQIDAMHSPTARLKSGGYIVINPTEALVAVDVNSGRATKERHIEETAFKTNLEAAEEVARQVRLRDLAGLIVIDFIDMNDNKHNREVERRLREAMSADRARIQMGRISPFGLLEMSRQRLRPSLVENSTVICPHCNGIGTIRTAESVALHALRILEENGIRRGGGVIALSVSTEIAFYLLNQKRHRITDIEQRYSLSITVQAEDGYRVDQYDLERISGHDGGSRDDLTPLVGKDATEPENRDQTESCNKDTENGRNSKRRRRRGCGGNNPEITEEGNSKLSGKGDDDDESGNRDRSPKRHHRGRRGGRRRGRRNEDSKRSDDEQSRDSAGNENDNNPAEGVIESIEPEQRKDSKRSRRIRGRSGRIPNPGKVDDDDQGKWPPEHANYVGESSGDNESPPPLVEGDESPPVSSSGLDATAIEGEEKTTPRVRRGRPSTGEKKAAKAERSHTPPRSPLGRRRRRVDNEERNEAQVADQTHQGMAVASAPASKLEASETKKPKPKADDRAEITLSDTLSGPASVAVSLDKGVTAAPAQVERPRPRRSGWWNRGP